MISVENDTVIIEVCPASSFEHDFISNLQRDLITLLNCAYVVKSREDIDYTFSSDFQAITDLQKALLPTVQELEQLYPNDNAVVNNK